MYVYEPKSHNCSDLNHSRNRVVVQACSLGALCECGSASGFGLGAAGRDASQIKGVLLEEVGEVDRNGVRKSVAQGASRLQTRERSCVQECPSCNELVCHFISQFHPHLPWSALTEA